MSTASARVAMNLNTASLSGFRSVATRLQDLTPIMRKAIPLIRDSVAREFLERAWFPPQGGRQPWAPVKPFGTRRAGGEKPLIDKGAYFEALMGRGAGAIVRIGPRSVSVGVDAATFPHAAILRGGTGASIRTSPWIIRPRKLAKGGANRTGARRWAMYWFFLFEYSVSVRDETLQRGLRLPTRPHLTRNPALANRLAKMALKHITRGAAA